MKLDALEHPDAPACVRGYPASMQAGQQGVMGDAKQPRGGVGPGRPASVERAGVLKRRGEHLSREIGRQIGIARATREIRQERPLVATVERVKRPGVPSRSIQQTSVRNARVSIHRLLLAIRRPIVTDPNDPGTQAATVGRTRANQHAALGDVRREPVEGLREYRARVGALRYATGREDLIEALPELRLPSQHGVRFFAQRDTAMDACSAGRSPPNGGRLGGDGPFTGSPEPAQVTRLV